MLDKVMTEILFTNPLSLLAIKDKQVIQEINSLVPYSCAFEIECDKGEHYNEEDFKNIPDIMDVDNGFHEQRYRIPNGLRGIICTYFICFNLKYNSLLNPLSSIHYHNDCTDCYDSIVPLIRTNSEYILSELDTWLAYGEEAISRGYGTWYKANALQTIEYRLGEMTFDYKIIIKRIIHTCAITKHFKDKLEGLKQPEYVTPDKDSLISYYKKLVSVDRTKYNRLLSLNRELEKLKESNKKTVSSNEVQQVMDMYRDRVHNIYNTNSNTNT